MKSDNAVSFVLAMLVLQVAATALLWILNVLSSESTSVFAVLLAADLISFAVVLQVYRNPDQVEGATAPAPSPAPIASPPQQVVSGPAHVAEHTRSTAERVVGDALPRLIHIGVPIASFLVILAFAVVAFSPPNKGTLPVESTLIFPPIYLMIVVILVFSSLYLFKRLLDTEEEAQPGEAARPHD